MMTHANGTALKEVLDLPKGAMLYHRTRYCPVDFTISDVIGIIPEFLDPEDERKAAVQIDEAYIGGWNPIPGFKFDRLTGRLEYPCKDEPTEVFYPWVSSALRDELILVYGAGITLIGQEDGSFSVARLS